jgi:microcystin-dependent protein
LDTKTGSGDPTCVDGGVYYNSNAAAFRGCVAGSWINLSEPSGSIFQYSGKTAPSGYLMADGSSVSRSTYANLFAVTNPSLGTFTVTIASPGVVTLTAHGLSNGDHIFFTTSGALPTGLAANTTYCVRNKAANTFEVATYTYATNTCTGSSINTTGSQSGTHTLYYSPYGVPDSTNFYLPDMRGRVPVGYAASGGHTDVDNLGNNDGVAVASRVAKKTITSYITSSAAYAGGGQAGPNYLDVIRFQSAIDGDVTSLPVGADYIVVNYIIKY